MALNIRNAETERLADALAKLTGETKTEAVTKAIRLRLEKLQREKSRRPLSGPCSTHAHRMKSSATTKRDCPADGN